MKKTFTFLGTMLVALGLRAHTSVPAKKETSARPAIIKDLISHSGTGALQQKHKAAPAAHKAAAYKSTAPAYKAPAYKAPAQLKSAAVHKAPAPRTTHR